MAPPESTSYDSEENSSSQCRLRGRWHRRNRNELDDVTVNHSPWGPTLQYAVRSAEVCLVIPIVVQLVHMLGKSMTELHLKMVNGTNTSLVRIDPHWFKPMGVIVAPVLSVAILLFLLFFVDDRWQRAIGRLAREVVEVLQRSCLLARTRSRAASAGTQSNPNVSTRVVFFGFAIIGGVVSWAAWYGPMTWWSDAAVQYRTCHRLCGKEVHTSGDAKQHDDFHDLCVRHMGLHAENYPADLFPDSEGNDRAGCPSTRTICKQILQAEMSRYTKHVLDRGHTFLAFESNVRQHYAISCVDIFGAVLELGVFVLVVSARAALQEQNSTLQRLRENYIKDHMRTDLGRWCEFFDQLCKEMKRSNSWTLKVLNAMKEAQDLKPGSELEVFEEDKNLNDITDDAENCTASPTSIFFTSFALVCAFLDASIPFFSRSLFHNNHACMASPDAERDFLIICTVSRFATFLGAFSSFYLFSSAYVRNKSQINAVIAFDCLFCFPLEHPQTTVLVTNGQSLQKFLHEEAAAAKQPAGNGAATSSSRAPASTHGPPDGTGAATSSSSGAAGGTNGPPDGTGAATSSSSRAAPPDGTGAATSDLESANGTDGRYFAHFTTLDGMNRDLKNFNFYFLGRQYLQLDKVDERNGLETAMVVALLSLIPRFLIVLCNFWLENGTGKFMQPVNAAFIWRLGYVFLLSVLSLLETMNLNEHFSMHHKKLQRLLKYNTYCGSREENVEENGAAALIKALVTLMESHDLPSTLFGLKVRWHMLAGFVGVWSLSVPQLFLFVSELIEYLAEQV